jgi:2-polyprenyl-3-methyl-5-hydroxy-6-metoxy-1,4-benzoquinol methylase
MSLFSRLIKISKDPFGVLSRHWIAFSERFRFAAGPDYRTKEYWKYRHGKYRFDLRGVGDKSKSHEENVSLLEQGSNVFLKVCQEANIVFNNISVLDIGCGTGHFAGVLRKNGVKNYLGIDIVDTLMDDLRMKYPGYRYQELDISMKSLKESYNLIIAMDVLQHIADENKFSFALDNIKSHLAPSGSIIISTYLGSYKRESFYFVRRPLEVFQEAFKDFTVNKPIPYADSFVFSLQKK